MELSSVELSSVERRDFYRAKTKLRMLRGDLHEHRWLLGITEHDQPPIWIRTHELDFLWELPAAHRATVGLEALLEWILSAREFCRTRRPSMVIDGMINDWEWFFDGEIPIPNFFMVAHPSPELVVKSQPWKHRTLEAELVTRWLKDTPFATLFDVCVYETPWGTQINLR